MNGLYIDKHGVDFDIEGETNDFGPKNEQPSGTCFVVECENCGKLTTNDLSGLCNKCQDEVLY